MQIRLHIVLPLFSATGSFKAQFGSFDQIIDIPGQQLLPCKGNPARSQH